MNGVKIRPRKACYYPNSDKNDGFRHDKVGVLDSLRDNSQEIDRRHVPRISEAIQGSGGIE